MIDPEGELRAAFAELDIEIVRGPDVHDGLRADFVLDPGGLGVHLTVKRLSLVTAATAEQLLREKGPTTGHDMVPMVLAHRITSEARTLLVRSGWGYLDLRGHLALRLPGRLMIDAEVVPSWSPPDRSEALAGRAGLEVATWLLMHPGPSLAVREIARQLHRSPSTVSTITAALRRERLVDETLRATGEQLFWAVADRWPDERTYVSDMPMPGNVRGVTEPLGLGLTDVEASTGWALTDSAAAAVMGAPIAVRSDLPLDFFVPNAVVLRRAERMLGPVRAREAARCSVRVAPVPAVCSQRRDAPSNPFGWPLAHPLFVALDLAQDGGRGREILESWVPDGGWDRVW